MVFGRNPVNIRSSGDNPRASPSRAITSSEAGVSRAPREPYLPRVRPMSGRHRRANGTARDFARWDATHGTPFMPSLMPSLLKYFAIVGGILFAGLIGLNAMLDPGGPGPKLVKEDRKSTRLNSSH